MRRCLRDKALLRLYEGEGSERQQAHLDACQACAKRYQRLVDDLGAIRRVLREEPPPRLFHPAPLSLGWAPLVTVITVTLVFVWGSMWSWTIAPPFPGKQPSQGEVWQFLGEVSSATLPAVTLEGAPTRESDFTYLRQALGEE